MALSKFQFLGYRILQSKIDLTEEQAEGESNFNIRFRASGEVRKSEHKFKLNLDVLVDNEDKSVTVELKTVGFFQFDPPTGDDTDTDISHFFYTNASAILFPYLRAYIGTLTNLSGLKPVNLPTMNLSSLATELKDNTAIIE